ncbi:MAG: threonine--tRNA ligase [Candidatus Sungbacteria bacterium RIFCSPLOWO2_12_FULL_41_11]|uniref:Threonine--tRNA ligase n=1 Tax=Candidatus Sungbacteria bacterium RIFCSPLOWO2_12_FULL_41_11 TaxID=1802286 RepID=A0A1G2LRV4_9BACT|nr:MAG: Threonine-tRNA ligase [Parcubacteria group bacterium GW2011_GWA2_42_14]OHA14273.1 MAG: threonine--tRNA ligase [Candidatus Sungbacteria bacterium RIFCSPLOWO2_12_FULL_41_11]
MKKLLKTDKIESIRHSLAHILAMAVLKKFPQAKLGVGPVIENGFYYDFLLKGQGTSDMGQGTTVEINLKDIEKEMRSMLKQNLDFKREKLTTAKVKKIFKEQPFKLDLIKEFAKEKKEITAYHTFSDKGKDTIDKEFKNPVTCHMSHVACFFDLCRGGHVSNTSEINPDAFKLTKISGAYWKGEQKNPQLTRIYGVAFETKEELKKYLWQQEESLKRDHRILGEKLKLFTFAEKVGPGLPLWLPKGTIIREEIENRAKKVEKDWGYERVATPHIAKEELYKMSGHIPYYAESMFPPMKLDDGNYYLKAMNCPHTHMIYKSEPRSYRDLPIRYAEYGTVYRYELSGTLAGLLRTRGFTQNDAHIYCREDQVEEEFLKVMKLHEFWYKNVFSITDFYMRLSLPTKNKDKFANIPEGWEKSVEILRSTMKKSGLPFIEAEGEAAFYGPKVDFQIKSVIGREETASTNQLDFLATKRFNLTYTDNDGKEKPVYVIHRAPLGSHERFIAFLIEHYAGEFPFWLAPVQTTVLTVTDRANSYAEEIVKTLKNKEIRVSYDQRNETIGKKIREAELQKIPYIIIIGDREMESKTISVRQHKKGDLGKMALEDFLKLADK